jgi:glucokinase
MLGRALGGLVNVFDPAAVVVGGGVLSAGPLYRRSLERAFRAELLPGTAGVSLRFSRLRNQAGVIGAAIMALDDEQSTHASGSPDPDVVTAQ